MDSKTWIPAILLFVACGGIAGAGELPSPRREKVDFSREVKPLLAEHCFKCHGPDKSEGGLNLADRSVALKKLESGTTAIVPGNSATSELVRRITHRDRDERMPPAEEKPLSQAEIETLRRWVEEGCLLYTSPSPRD